jgi:glycine cleavage system H protein
MQGHSSTLYYRRARFSTRLPRRLLYLPSHFWLYRVNQGHWRIGLTRFATRMLGDLVEYHFEVQPGAAVCSGDAIGWIEGFKAVSDVYCAISGLFLGANSELEGEPTRLDNDPYDGGWLYEASGGLDVAALDVDGYVKLLDATIDRMLSQADEGGDSCPVPRT